MGEMHHGKTGLKDRIFRLGMVCLNCIFGGNGIAMEIIKSIQNRIYEIRGERVMLDFDLADLYETETKILNQAVKRNI